jgi:hydroxyacylglutathione hydrolase
LNIETLVVGARKTNCYIIWNECRDCLVIDPGADEPAIVRFVDEMALSVRGILITHGHPDHVSAAARLQESCPSKVWLHRSDLELAFGEEHRTPQPFPAPRRPACGIVHMEDEELIFDYPFPVRALHVPGHSPGSVAYYFIEENTLFCGDTIFRGLCGSTGFPGSSAAALGLSLKKIMRLPSQTLLMPGHGNATTIQAEREHNYGLKSI